MSLETRAPSHLFDFHTTFRTLETRGAAEPDVGSE